MLVPINEQTWSLISNNVLSITHSGSDVVTQLDSGRLRLLEKNLESSLTSCCQRDGWNRVEDSGKWNAQLLGLTATWCEVPHPCPNCLFFISSRWNREGVVKSTDMLALGGPPCKNSSFCAAVDTYSCRFLSSQDTLADEFRNYTGFPNCYYGTKQALLRTSSWPHQCPVRHRGREEKRKKTLKACFTPFRSFRSSWKDGIHAEKSLENNYKGICPQMQNNTYQNIL